jgi:putative ABC transport system substrate-binding protein
MSPILTRDRKQIIDRAAKYRLPAIYEWREHVEVGGLMSYGGSLIELSRRVAAYVDKILKGAKPGDLPVEQPTKIELVINLKTAKALGLTIPPSLLLRADQALTHAAMKMGVPSRRRRPGDVAPTWYRWSPDRV